MSEENLKEFERKNDVEDDDSDFNYDEKPPKDNSPQENKEVVAKNTATGTNQEDVIKNQHYDEAMDLSDSGDNVESEDDEEEPEIQNMAPNQDNQRNVQLQEDNDDDDEDEDDEEYPAQAQAMPANAYNPMDYANLNVSSEVSELFQYINRYKPHNIELESKLKPFIPDYIPAVGEVDAFLKIPRPDGQEETLGLAILDEPTLDTTDPTVLEMQYINAVKIPTRAPLEVRSIELAEKNPKQIQQWIFNVNELHKVKPPATVQYSKNMPDIDNLMQEWPQEMEEALDNIEFPGPDIALSTADYAKLICLFLDIPIHKLNNEKSLVEALHVFFTLYHDFKLNPHFQTAARGMESTGQEENFLKIQ